MVCATPLLQLLLLPHLSLNFHSHDINWKGTFYRLHDGRKQSVVRCLCEELDLCSGVLQQLWSAKILLACLSHALSLSSAVIARCTLYRSRPTTYLSPQSKSTVQPYTCYCTTVVSLLSWFPFYHLHSSSRVILVKRCCITIFWFSLRKSSLTIGCGVVHTA